MKYVPNGKFPVDLVNEYSKVEKKRGGTPPHWEMVFWWTRKPLTSARAVIAYSLLGHVDFHQLFSCNERRAYMCPPSPVVVQKLRGKKLLDPFAGFGSIPLEALRLGLDVTAVELLPTAYVFLKAVLEYPRKYQKLDIDIERIGREVVEKLRQKIGHLYSADAYIGTWEVKCPHCGRYTPLISNWWLAKKKEGNKYRRLAWFQWQNGKIEIIEIQNAEDAKVTPEAVEVKKQIYKLPKPNVDMDRRTARCLHCGVEISHRVEDGKVTRASGGDWYVKWAIKKWEENFYKYINNSISLDELKNSPARPTLLVKIVKKTFMPADERDIQNLWEAAAALPRQDPDIPTERTPVYENRSGTFAIFERWLSLYNPRQLLSLISLIKLIRETIEKNFQDTKRESMAVYLGIALVRFASYSSMITYWDHSAVKVGQTMAFRLPAITWNWAELSPWADMTGSFARSLKNVVEGVRFLSKVLANAPGSVQIVLGDAASFKGGVYDVVVTDPPYADDVPYAETSDFYYVWLKRVLSKSDGRRLVKWLLPEAFFDEFDVEIETQWQHFAKSEVSEDENRFKYFGISGGYDELLARAFRNIVRLTDGPIVVYYVAKKPEAWRALINALWKVCGLKLIEAFPVATESEENVVARGKASVLGGYVSIWKKRDGERPLDIVEARELLVEEVSRRIKERLGNGAASKATAWIYAYLSALEVLTSYYPVKAAGVELGANELINFATALALEGMFKRVGIHIDDVGARAYVVLRIVENNNGAVDSDLLSHVERAVGISHVDMMKLGLIRGIDSGGSRVAKRKSFRVMAPRSGTPDELATLFRSQRGSSVLSCFRQLQLRYAAKSRVDCDSEGMRGAKLLATALVELSRLGLLDSDDIDVKISKSILGTEWWQ